jgi:hypothetical protein
MTTRARWISVAAILGACAAYAVFLGPPAPAGASPEAPAHVLRFHPPRVDFGEIPVGESRTAEVRIENTGSSPLGLRNVLPNCSCLKVEVPVRSIPPGGSGALRITYAAGGAAQSQRMLVQVFFDHPACPLAVLPVTGRARQEIAVEPRVLQFGKLRRDEAKTLEAVVRSVDGRPFDLRPLRFEHAVFESSAEPLEPGRKDAYRIRVTARGSRPGWTAEAARLMTDDSGAVRGYLYLNAGGEGP